MIHLVTALPSEARPLIRRFALERVDQGRPAVWRGPGVALVVSGIGRRAAVEAVLGEIVLAREVVDRADGSVRRLRPLAEPRCALVTVTTVDRPELEYPDEAVYDMEAAAFCAAVTSRGGSGRLQVAKVISDNLLASPDRLTAELVEELIEGRIDVIAGIAERTAAG